MKPNLKVVIDTNLWISFLISKDLHKLDKYILNNNITLIFSEELFYEFITVSSRPKLLKYFKPSAIEDLIDLFDTYGQFIDVTSNVEKCRDIKDNFLLSLAIDSKADFLITGDKDLLILKEIDKTKIISITNFLDFLKNSIT